LTPLGELTTLPRPLAAFKGREDRRGEGEEGRRGGNGRKGKGEGRDEVRALPL